jgi:hypothetical protein
MDLPFVYSSSLLFFSLEWSLPSPFIDARRTQGYMYVLCDIFPGKEDLMPPLSPVVGDVPLLEEWLLSFDVVAMCPAIRSPMDDAATTRTVVMVLVAM